MMRLLRTVAYWVRFILRPATVSWTADDDYEFEWELAVREYQPGDEDGES